MVIGITPELEEGFCSICKRKKQVRYFVDSVKGVAAAVCIECALPSKETAEEILEKYGEPSEKAKSVSIVEKKEWIKQQGKN